MYYEEKIINGVMCYRIDPNDEFKPYSIEELSQQYAFQKRRANNYEQQLKGIAINILKQFPSEIKKIKTR